CVLPPPPPLAARLIALSIVSGSLGGVPGEHEEDVVERGTPEPDVGEPDLFGVEAAHRLGQDPRPVGADGHRDLARRVVDVAGAGDRARWSARRGTGSSGGPPGSRRGRAAAASLPNTSSPSDGPPG